MVKEINHLTSCGCAR